MHGIKKTLGLLVGVANFVFADSDEKLLLLPIVSDSLSTENKDAINRLYRDALESQFKGTLLPSSTSTESCGYLHCALKAAQNSKADAVIYSTFNRLGSFNRLDSKWVFKSTLVKTNGSDALNERLTGLSMENMETATKQMAGALLNYVIQNKEPRDFFPQLSFGLGAQTNGLGVYLLLGADVGDLFYGARYSGQAASEPGAFEPFGGTVISNPQNENRAVDILIGIYEIERRTPWSLRSGLSYLYFTRQGALINVRACSVGGLDHCQERTYEEINHHAIGIPLEIIGVKRWGKRKVWGGYISLGGNFNLYEPYVYFQTGFILGGGKPRKK